MLRTAGIGRNDRSTCPHSHRAPLAGRLARRCAAAARRARNDADGWLAVAELLRASGPARAREYAELLLEVRLLEAENTELRHLIAAPERGAA